MLPPRYPAWLVTASVVIAALATHIIRSPSLLTMAAGLGAGVLLVTCYGVTRRAEGRAVRRLSISLAELEASRAQSRCLIDHAPVPIGVYTNGVVVFANEAATLAYGGPLVGVPVARIVSPPVLPEVEAKIAALRAGAERVELFDERLVRADGTTRQMHLVATPILYNGLPSVQVVCRDVTERHEADLVKERAFQAALHASQTKHEFLAVMSHELRTPLTAVMGYAELLRDAVAGPLNATQVDMADRIDTSAKHLLSLIEQMLDISKAERGQLAADLEPVDVADVVRSAMVLLEPSASKRGLVIYTNIPHGPVRGDTDLAKLRQVVVNLVSNALKFTDTGSVTVELRATASTLTLGVRDTGIGIAPEHQGQVFEPFFRVDHGYNRLRDGSGLGLAITREIVECLGGSLSVRSTPGEGSLFEVRLPRYVDDPVEAPAPRANGGPPGPAAALRWTRHAASVPA